MAEHGLSGIGQEAFVLSPLDSGCTALLRCLLQAGFELPTAADSGDSQPESPVPTSPPPAGVAALGDALSGPRSSAITALLPLLRSAAAGDGAHVDAIMSAIALASPRTNGASGSPHLHRRTLAAATNFHADAVSIGGRLLCPSFHTAIPISAEDCAVVWAAMGDLMSAQVRDSMAWLEGARIEHATTTMETLAHVVDEVWILQENIVGVGASPDVSVQGLPKNVHSYFTAVAARLSSALAEDAMPQEGMTPQEALFSMQAAWPALADALQPTADPDARGAVLQAWCLAAIVATVRTDQEGDVAAHLGAVKVLSYLGPAIRGAADELSNDLVSALILRAYERRLEMTKAASHDSSIDPDRREVPTTAAPSEADSELLDATATPPRALFPSVADMRRDSDGTSVGSTSPSTGRRRRASSTGPLPLSSNKPPAPLSRSGSGLLQAVTAQRIGPTRVRAGSLLAGEVEGSAGHAFAAANAPPHGTTTGTSSDEADEGGDGAATAAGRGYGVAKDEHSVWHQVQSGGGRHVAQAMRSLVQFLMVVQWAVYAIVDAVVSRFLEDSSVALYYEGETRARHTSVTEPDESHSEASNPVPTEETDTGSTRGTPVDGKAPRTLRRREQAAVRSSSDDTSLTNAMGAVQRLMQRRRETQREETRHGEGKHDRGKRKDA